MFLIVDLFICINNVNLQSNSLHVWNSQNTICPSHISWSGMTQLNKLPQNCTSVQDLSTILSLLILNIKHIHIFNFFPSKLSPATHHPVHCAVHKCVYPGWWASHCWGWEKILWASGCLWKWTLRESGGLVWLDGDVLLRAKERRKITKHDERQREEKERTEKQVVFTKNSKLFSFLAIDVWLIQEKKQS